MKIVVQMSKSEFEGFQACEDEVKDWVAQMLHSSADAWDGGLVMFDVSQDDIFLEVY